MFWLEFVLFDSVQQGGEGDQEQKAGLHTAGHIAVGELRGNQIEQPLSCQTAQSRTHRKPGGAVKIQDGFLPDGSLAHVPAGHGDDGTAGQKGDRSYRHDAGGIQNRLDNDAAAHAAYGAEDTGREGNQNTNPIQHYSTPSRFGGDTPLGITAGVASAAVAGAAALVGVLPMVIAHHIRKVSAEGHIRSCFFGPRQGCLFLSALGATLTV